MDYDYSYGGTSSAGTEMAFAALIPLLLFYLVLIAFSLIVMWKVFTKAGRPGWAALIPVYNYMVFAEIVGRPNWVGLLMLVPLLQIYVIVILMLDLAKSFGKDVVFGVMLILFSILAMAFLAFDKNSKYVGPVSTGKTIEP